MQEGYLREHYVVLCGEDHHCQAKVLPLPVAVVYYPEAFRKKYHDLNHSGRRPGSR